ncbi:MAG: ATP synthase A1 subunit C [Planctomycetota bacterium]|jgi:V/A-type H+-transporting ATPase subunit C
MGKLKETLKGFLHVMDAWKKRSQGKSAAAPKKTRAGASNYPYVVARVKAMKPSFVPRDTMTKMITMDVPQITRLVGESAYRQEVDALGMKYKGVDLLENALNLNLGRTISKIVGWSKGELREMLETYFSQYDGQNLKSVLRAKKYNAPPEELELALVGAGQHETDFWLRLSENESYDDILKGLEGTVFAEPLKAVRAENESWDDLAPYEEAIDRLYYQRLAVEFTGKTKAKLLARDFIGRMIDATNMRTLFALKNENVPEDQIAARLMPGGVTFTEDIWKKLTQAADISACVEILRQHPIYPHISEGLDEAVKGGSLGTLGRLLKRWRRTKTGSFRYMHPLSILPIFDFILHKQKEIDNIRIIARGKDLGLPEKTIEFLVWPD